MGTKTRGSPSGPVDSEKTTLNFAVGTVASHATTTVTTALTGVRTTDIVQVIPAVALAAGLVMESARVSAAGVITLTFANVTAAAVNQATMTVYALTHKFST